MGVGQRSPVGGADSAGRGTVRVGGAKSEGYCERKSHRRARSDKRSRQGDQVDRTDLWRHSQAETQARQDLYRRARPRRRSSRTHSYLARSRRSPRHSLPHGRSCPAHLEQRRRQQDTQPVGIGEQPGVTVLASAGAPAIQRGRPRGPADYRSTSRPSPASRAAARTSAAAAASWTATPTDL